VVFALAFVYIMDYIDGFQYIKPSIHLWDEAYLIMMDDRFDVFLGSVCENFIEHFCIDIQKGNWSEVLFLCWDFVWKMVISPEFQGQTLPEGKLYSGRKSAQRVVE
jgi:hypothetical protein